MSGYFYHKTVGSVDLFQGSIPDDESGGRRVYLNVGAVSPPMRLAQSVPERHAITVVGQDIPGEDSPIITLSAGDAVALSNALLEAVACAEGRA